MKIVIDIPKFVYDMTKAQKKVIDADVEIVGKAIANGTPLPKGHGRLIDSELLDKRLRFVLNHTGGYKKTPIGTGIVIAMAENLDAPTVLDAEAKNDD